MNKVTIIDYGASNLLNVVRALEHCGVQVEIAETSEPIARASTLVFPGVGAFGDCMAALRERDLITAIKEYIVSNKPFLGICVGMQVMFEVGEEFGEHTGLGIIKGRVVRIPSQGTDGIPHKIPHIGWSDLQSAQSWAGTILEPLQSTQMPRATYFVHSYMGVPANPSDCLATVDYDGISICASIKHGNAYGCQFHPEKSSETGLAILKAFLALSA